MRNSEEAKGISYLTLLYIAWRNLVTKRLRTLLTLFGVSIGIGAIFFLLAMGLGLHNLVNQQVIGNESIKSVDITTTSSKILRLDDSLVTRLKNLPHVGQIGTAYSFPGSLNFNGGTVDAVSYGVDNNYEQLNNFTLAKGRFLTDTDSKQIMLNVAALKTIGINDVSQAIGQNIDINIPLTNIATKADAITGTFKIVGVINEDAGGELFIPNINFQAAGVPYYSQVRLSVDDTSNVADVRSQIESMGYQTSSPIDTLNQIDQIFKIFTAILVGFGGIGMIVSILGMFNTLTISLLERTKEIGLMIALGARNNDMRRLFILEASLLSLFGAVLGVLSGIILGEIFQAVMNAFAHHRGVSQSFQIFSAPWATVLGSILFMLLVGLLVVYYPSKRAKSINPIDALRRE